MMYESRFDVNDAAVRNEFLRHQALAAMAGLNERTHPRWGRMAPQQMVEHLIWAFELSIGKAETVCMNPESDLPRVKSFLYSNRPTRRGVRIPALASGLPPLRYASLDEAKAVLGQELQCFLEDAPRAGRLYTHPVFGPIGHEEWHRAHYKHTHHHLLQFGLIGPL